VGTKHPVERGAADERDAFARAAELASNLASSPQFFGVCLLLVAGWAASYILGLGDKAQHLLGEGMAAVTLLLVATLKNAELRAERALQEKLDAIAAALLEQRQGDTQEAQQELQRAIGLHEEL
jgi:low affinity Fe/Cu permease